MHEWGFPKQTKSALSPLTVSTLPGRLRFTLGVSKSWAEHLLSMIRLGRSHRFIRIRSGEGEKLLPGSKDLAVSAKGWLSRHHFRNRK